MLSSTLEKMLNFSARPYHEAICFVDRLLTIQQGLSQTKNIYFNDVKQQAMAACGFAGGSWSEGSKVSLLLDCIQSLLAGAGF